MRPNNSSNGALSQKVTSGFTAESWSREALRKGHAPNNRATNRRVDHHASNQRDGMVIGQATALEKNSSNENAVVESTLSFIIGCTVGGEADFVPMTPGSSDVWIDPT